MIAPPTIQRFGQLLLRCNITRIIFVYSTLFKIMPFERIYFSNANMKPLPGFDIFTALLNFVYSIIKVVKSEYLVISRL